MYLRLLVAFFVVSVAMLKSAERKLVMIAGPVSHPPLMHEFRAGSILLQKRLQDVPELTTVLVTNGWPTKIVNGETVDDNAVFEDVLGDFLERRVRSRLRLLEGR